MSAYGDVISTRCWNMNQSWYYESIYKKKHKLRVKIRRNAYDNQSFANVFRWDGNQWQLVCGKSIMECKCQTISYVNKDVTAADFKQDEEELLREALAIVE